MGWEERGGRLYYYRSRRVGGRVVKEYVGSGPDAELIVDVEEEARRAERRRRESERAERELLSAEDKEVAEVYDLIDRVAKAALIEAGYRQHNRGEWRLKRGPGAR